MLNNQDYSDIDFSDIYMMRLTPDGISRTWHELKMPIELSLPPISNPSENPARMTRILEDLLMGSLQCFIFYVKQDSKTVPFGMCITAIIDAIGGNRSLLLYAAYGHTSFIKGSGLVSCIKKLSEYASGQGCNSITAYSNIPTVIDAIRDLGGNTDYRLLTLEV